MRYKRAKKFLEQRAIEFQEYKTVSSALNNKEFNLSSGPDDIVLAVSRYDKEVEFNLVGAIIWESTESPVSKKEIVKNLLNFVEVNEEQAVDDVELFLEQLVSLGLLEEIGDLK